MSSEYDQSSQYEDYNQDSQAPERVFSSDDFDGRIEPTTRHSSKMPKTNAEHQQEWRKRNPEKNREYMRQYMAKRRETVQGALQTIGYAKGPVGAKEPAVKLLEFDAQGEDFSLIGA